MSSAPASGMALRVALPEHGIEAIVSLYEERAPTVCRAIFESVATPFESRTAHACFDGHAVYTFLPEFPEEVPVENSTMRPSPGDVMFYQATVNSFAWLHDDQERMAPRGVDVQANELSFIYGPVKLDHDLGAAFYGSLVGRVTAGRDEFTRMCAHTLDHGNTRLCVTQA